jgi:hypothetical protein
VVILWTRLRVMVMAPHSLAPERIYNVLVCQALLHSLSRPFHVPPEEV